MRHLTLLSALLLVLLLAGCKPKQPPTHPASGNGGGVAVQPTPPAQTGCTEQPGRGPAPSKDGFASFSAKLTGDCLHLKYSYAGGCKEHAVGIYWDGNWAETMPPQTHLHVSHNAQGDACDAIVAGESTFDIKELRYAGVGQVIVDLHPPSGAMVRLNYTYSAK